MWNINLNKTNAAPMNFVRELYQIANPNELQQSSLKGIFSGRLI